MQTSSSPELLAMWLHPDYEQPVLIDAQAGDNTKWSWALSVEQPHSTAARKAAGWLLDTEAESVSLITFKLGQFALYRLLYECRRDEMVENPNEPAEAVLRALGQDYGPNSSRLCGAYLLISLETPLMAAA